ncbi:MAG: ankyrin repeat domain-containing protein [Bacteroidota bacterium]
MTVKSQLPKLPPPTNGQKDTQAAPIDYDTLTTQLQEAVNAYQQSPPNPSSLEALLDRLKKDRQVKREAYEPLREIFLEAIKNEKLDTIQHIIQKLNTSVDYDQIVSKKSPGKNILMYFAWKGYTNIVQRLLQNRANPNATDNKGATPLHYAAQCKNPENRKALINLLLENGANPQLKNNQQNNFLHFLCYQGDLDLLKELEKRETPISIQPGQRDYMAPSCQSGNLDLVEYVAQKNYPITAKNESLCIVNALKAKNNAKALLVYIIKEQAISAEDMLDEEIRIISKVMQRYDDESPTSYLRKNFMPRINRD